MEGYIKIIKLLESKGIEFADGLTNEEIINIEILYNFVFPKELKRIFTNKITNKQTAFTIGEMLQMKI